MVYFNSLRHSGIPIFPQLVLRNVVNLFYGLIFLFLISPLASFTSAQEVDIIPYLKNIEKGNKEAVQSELPKLLKEYPNSSNVLFLKAVLTENGQEAVAIYGDIVKNYPKSKYADASLYRIYTYYYALGMYGAAKTFLNKLKKDYPLSPYIGIAEKEIPAKDKVLVNVKTANDSSSESSTRKKLSSNIDKTFYSVQAGAFTILTNAQSLQETFQGAGYFSIIQNKTVGGTDFHVVYVGKYTDSAKAQKLLQYVNSKFSLNGRVVKLNLPGGE